MGALGNDQSCAFGIAPSGAGVIVGDLLACASFTDCQPNDDATAWSLGGSPQTLDELNGGNAIQGRGINDAGTIVGYGRLAGTQGSVCKRHAVAWEDEQEAPFDLHAGGVPALSTLAESIAFAINDTDGNGRRQTVGQNLTENLAILWESSAAEVWCPIDLTIC